MSRKIKKINWVGEMPQCDFCTSQGARPIRDGVYDMPTILGPWANACHTHMLQYAPKNSTLVAKRVKDLNGPPAGEVLLNNITKLSNYEQYMQERRAEQEARRRARTT